ncbi:MAG TPA: dockerin type I domain-containing protein [Acetivibrio sp.]|uniref:dockerin type I domain-containing protein n=1 Tax=Acetivibrio sp. TaxID=1872092 RepID=UPI002C7D1398|nr:dockerin type I domain-containing protein [Acetivibrio sp.]HOM01558.1 dockerin type I domain-containing protein [Acetivibrio sp.]
MRKYGLLLLIFLSVIITIAFGMISAGAESLYGDLNANGSIESTDLMIMKRALLKSLTIDDIAVADLDGNGAVSSTDFMLLKRYLLKMINQFPVESSEPAITPTPTPAVTPTPTEVNEESFMFKIRTTKDNEVYGFPIISFSETYNIVVYWGDGSTSTITDYSSREHKYQSAGIFTIKVISFDFMPLRFKKDKNLIEVLTPLPDIGTNNFYEFFSDCSNLTNIPEGLFDNNIYVTNFRWCFANCSSLTEIPKGLFDNNVNVTDFNSCFRDCENLVEIPEGLFDNNLSVTDFASCFWGCKNLTGLAPDLWMRSNVKYSNSCFYGCTKLSNYDEIPGGWR